MSWKLNDFRCVKCRAIEEFMYFSGDKIEPWHCGLPMIKMPANTVMFANTHFSKAIGKEITSYGQLDRELQRTNSYIPTAYEAAQCKQMTEAGIEPVIIQKRDDSKLIRSIEKAKAKLHSQGKYSEEA